MAYVQWLNVVGLLLNLVGIVLLFRREPKPRDNHRLFLTDNDNRWLAGPSERKKGAVAFILHSLLLDQRRRSSASLQRWYPFEERHDRPGRGQISLLSARPAIKRSIPDKESPAEAG
jgi:hypothetical protein